MMRLTLLLLGVTAGRWHWAALAVAAVIWGALGIAIFIDGLNGIDYFPLRAFAVLFLADTAIAFLLAPSGLGAQKWLRCVRGTLLQGSVDAHTDRSRRQVLGDTNGPRASELQHPVQGVCSNGHFRRLTAMRPRAESTADHSFIPPDRRPDQGAPIISASLLPAHTA